MTEVQMAEFRVLTEALGHLLISGRGEEPLMGAICKRMKALIPAPGDYVVVSSPAHLSATYSGAASNDDQS